jgi:hypothetical protein
LSALYAICSVDPGVTVVASGRTLVTRKSGLRSAMRIDVDETATLLSSNVSASSWKLSATT